MRKLVSFEVWGYECTPWSVPNVGRFGGCYYSKKSRPHAGILNIKDWQARVKDAAQKAMDSIGAKLQLGPTKTHIDFYTVTPPGHRHGELWTIGVKWNPKVNKGSGGWVKDGRSRPDILNLFKGTEDAVENVIYANDVQTSIISSARWYAVLPGVKVTVFLIEPGDFPGTGEPVPIEVKRAEKKTRKVDGE